MESNDKSFDSISLKFMEPPCTFMDKDKHWNKPKHSSIQRCTHHSYTEHGDKLTKSSNLTDAYTMIMLDKPEIDNDAPTSVKIKACRELANMWEKDRLPPQIPKRITTTAVRKNLKSIDAKMHDQLFKDFCFKERDLQAWPTTSTRELYFNTLRDLHPYIKSASKILDADGVAHSIEKLNSAHSQRSETPYEPLVFKQSNFINFLDLFHSIIQKYTIIKPVIKSSKECHYFYCRFR